MARPKSGESHPPFRANPRSIGSWRDIQPNEHFMQVYHSDEYLVDCLAGYVADGLQKGERVILVASREHEEALTARLASKGIDIVDEEAAGHVTMFGAEATLARVMLEHGPDVRAFEEIIGAAVRKAAGRGRSVRVFGELVGLLWRDGVPAAAIELERLWNELRAEVPFALYCAYPSKFANPGQHAKAAADIRQAHAAIIDAK